MNVQYRLFALFLIAILLAGCAPAVSVPGLPSASDADMTATAIVSALTGVATGDFGATPNPVYYGSGCGAGESTQLIAYLNSTGAWTKDAVVPADRTLTSLQVGLVYEFLNVPTTLGIPGKVSPMFSEGESIPGYRTAIADLSTEIFTGEPGILMLSFYVSATFLEMTSPFTFVTSTEIVYNSGYVSVPVLPCAKATPTPIPVNYHGTIFFSPDTIYKGPCTGGEPEELAIEVKPGAPITDPAIEQWAVLRYYPISTGKPFGDMSYKLTQVGDTWKAFIKTSDWGAITEDGTLMISIRVQTGDPTSPTILQEWNNFEAALPSTVTLKMCKPAAPAMTVTCPADITHTSSSPSGMAVLYGFPTVTGSCPGAWYFTCTPPSGSALPIGVTKLNCTVVDSCGSIATCNFNATILYNPPVVQTDTPEPQVVPTNTPAFDCSTLDQTSCQQGPHANECHWVPPDPNNGIPNGVCKNNP